MSDEEKSNLTQHEILAPSSNRSPGVQQLQCQSQQDAGGSDGGGIDNHGASLPPPYSTNPPEGSSGYPQPQMLPTTQSTCRDPVTAAYAIHPSARSPLSRQQIYQQQREQAHSTLPPEVRPPAPSAVLSASTTTVVHPTTVVQAPAPSATANNPTPPTINPTTTLQTGSLQVVTSVPIVQGVLGDRPMTVGCSNCQSMIMTTTDWVAGKHTWTMAAVYFILGFILIVPFCLCWIPFCQRRHKDVEHYCPNCGACMGRYKR